MGAANGAMMGREERQRRIMARMPDEVTEVMKKRIEHREGKMSYEAAMYKREETPKQFRMGNAGPKCVMTELFVREGMA